MTSFAIGEHDFLLDEQPFQIISGALHYFRIHPEQWRDRIHTARLMGLNTIETYVPWNEHEPHVGRLSATGRLDLVRFLTMVQDEGMKAIVRPGPFICAEWDNGGLPGWLTARPGIAVRTTDPAFFEPAERYLSWVYDLVAPLQVNRGGPIIAVQIENEYGAYGNDKQYLGALIELAVRSDIEVPLLTCDQANPTMLADGSIAGAHPTGTFGSRAAERLAVLRAHQPTGPLMCMEFWNGWFDHWGSSHHVTSAEESARELDVLLSRGASVNIYMVHGGTNFGLTNGANDKGTYQPTVTSYDYDAPMDEAGRPTAKYFAMRDVIAKYVPVEQLPAREHRAPAQFAVDLDREVSLASVLEDLGSWSHHDRVPTMDELGCYRGLAWYRAGLDTVPAVGGTAGGAGAPGAAVLDLGDVRDRAQVFVDGAPVGALERARHDRAIAVPRGSVLDVLVEDQGRVNYGPRLGEPKGLCGPVTIDGHDLTQWDVLVPDLDAACTVALARGVALPTDRPSAGPVFMAGTFRAPAGEDLFLATGDLGKGFVWINGFLLGRYWCAGPQQTLYVPGPLVVDGPNTVVVLELSAARRARVEFVADLDLGWVED